MKIFYLVMLVVWLSACSVFGISSVEVAPYSVNKTNHENNIELRHYDQLLLVSAPMTGDMDSGRNSAFSVLFDYISGNNVPETDISMTAPVFMNQASQADGVNIPMTAPVLMDSDDQVGTMSFVLPASYSLRTAPKPIDSNLEVSEIKDIKYAVIQFSGLLNTKNIQAHREILEQWINNEELEIIGQFKTAGYNPPFTIPALRRNEVLIPVRQP